MSKMPAKKKSCFQITSVTTAQVATSITEDTESLDDPDESRTEDVSSEIFDVSRATDYGPEEVCERSSSEETLNNVGDAETPGTVSPNLPLDGQLAAAAAAPANGGGAVSARSVAGALANTLSAAATSTPASGAPGAHAAGGLSAAPGTAAPSQPPTTCSSRFRVIKLDHGSGEPYRRGRWTCMEYYERDSDSSVLTRSGDCIRHSSTFDQTAERDSGLGATGGSVVVVVASMQGAHGPDSGTDSSLTAVSQLPPSEKMNLPASAPRLSFGVGQPQPPLPVGGAVAPSSAPMPSFSGAAAGPQQIMAAPQPAQPQGTGPGVVPPGPSAQGLPPTNVTLAQPGMSLPPQPGPAAGASATQQPQQFAYPQPQIPPGHLMPVQPSGPSEYLQQHHVAGLKSPSPAQPSATGAGASPAAAASLPVGTGQNTSSGGTHIMGASSVPSETVAPGPGPAPGGQAAHFQPAGVPPAAMGGAGQPGLVPAGAGKPQSAPPPQLGGSGAPSAGPTGPHAVVPGVPNVPAAVPAPSVPSVSTTSVTMPNVPAPLVPSQQLSSHTPVSRSGSLIQHVGLPLAQGTPNAASLPQPDLSQFQTQTQSLVGQVDDTRRKSEPLPQPPLSLIAENKPVVKPPVADALANPLQLTPMNSLATSVFSIAIPVDGDEDSASGGGGVAIDNKIEQAMDLVKSHLMYAVREEVEVLKEQIKELVERNSLLERENALLKSLSNNDQLSQLPAQQANPGSTSQQQAVIAQPPQPTQPPQQPNVSSA
ncbi:PREDICTED: TSC22 domain family protein 2 isoform X2 [Hipposideros armiger]|uniref:TSC22 domain family protein 2 isoform X2 n=1 Tax=Hipposideros armiger TaxID=186990 RepID=A0A8B7STY9_HIPAR|nr:PREDICTED: TSC22 domain family protein 2 isoform X2 [Hipposideros armiger]